MTVRIDSSTPNVEKEVCTVEGAYVDIASGNTGSSYEYVRFGADDHMYRFEPGYNTSYYLLPGIDTAVQQFCPVDE